MKRTADEENRGGRGPLVKRAADEENPRGFLFYPRPSLSAVLSLAVRRCSASGESSDQEPSA